MTRNNNIKGIYGICNTLSLCVLDIEYGIDDRIVYSFSNNFDKVYKRKVYYNAGGDAYFITQIGRVYLNEVLSV